MNTIPIEDKGDKDYRHPSEGSQKTQGPPKGAQGIRSVAPCFRRLVPPATFLYNKFRYFAINFIIMQEARFIQNLSKMVALKTVAGNFKEIDKLLAFVKNFFKGQKVVFREFKKNKIRSLIVSNAKTLDFDILYCTHLDVVPAEDSQFKLIKKGNKLFGRGAADDKGEALIGMMLFEKLLKENKLRDKKFGLLFATDEEIGSENGVEYLVKQVGLKAKVILLPDAGEDHNIIQAAKGLFHVNIEAAGKESHGSQPWFGDNAIEKLFQVFLEIKSIFPEKISPKDFWKNSINLGKFSGGKVVNQVPSKASMSIDIRYIDQQSRQRILTKLKGIPKKFKDIKITEIKEGNMMFLDSRSPYITQVQVAAKKVLNKKLNLVRECGGTDGRHFSAKGMDVLAFAPKMGNIHTQGEWLDLKSAKQYYQIAKLFIEDFE